MRLLCDFVPSSVRHDTFKGSGARATALESHALDGDRGSHAFSLFLEPGGELIERRLQVGHRFPDLAIYAS